MTWADWGVLVLTLLAIILYGLYRSRGTRTLQGYLLAGRSMRWYAVAFSIMATQASAITFLSTPGQAYADGMRFVQFYFGLPIAMVVLSVTAVPLYHRLKVYTAYEYLEGRFDAKTRALTASLFLIQRGLAAGLTILAPALVLSVLLGWDLTLTNLVIGVLVILYTTLGGTRAVSWTHLQQMIIIFVGMFAAFVVIILRLPQDVSFLDAVRVSGAMGRLNAVDFTFDLSNRYTFWSGILGGTFLALSYFGTDQSQVQRYLTGRSVTESRMALIANGFIKVPMQFFILFIGAMVFAFYQFQPPPIFFNPVERQKLRDGAYAEAYATLEQEHRSAHAAKAGALRHYLDLREEGGEGALREARAALDAAEARTNEIRSDAIALMIRNDPAAETNDTNYIFLTFILDHLPIGIVGLLLACVLAASMSSGSGGAERAGHDDHSGRLQTSSSARGSGEGGDGRFTTFHGTLGSLRYLLCAVCEQPGLAGRGGQYSGIPLLWDNAGDLPACLLCQEGGRERDFRRGGGGGGNRAVLLCLYRHFLALVQRYRLRGGRHRCILASTVRAPLVRKQTRLTVRSRTARRTPPQERETISSLSTVRSTSPVRRRWPLGSVPWRERSILPPTSPPLQTSLVRP